MEGADQNIINENAYIFKNIFGMLVLALLISLLIVISGCDLSAKADVTPEGFDARGSKAVGLNLKPLL